MSISIKEMEEVNPNVVWQLPSEQSKLAKPLELYRMKVAAHTILSPKSKKLWNPSWKDYNTITL